MKNILLIGAKDILKKLGKDIWRKNTETYLVSVTDIKDIDFKSFCFKSDAPILCIFDEGNLVKATVNEVMEFCEKFNFVPMFVTDSNKTITHSAFLTLNDRYRDSMEYTTNKNNEGYEEFVDICANYLHGKD